MHARLWGAHFTEPLTSGHTKPFLQHTIFYSNGSGCLVATIHFGSLFSCASGDAQFKLSVAEAM